MGVRVRDRFVIVHGHLVKVDEPLPVGRLPEGGSGHEALRELRHWLGLGLGLGLGFGSGLGLGFGLGLGLGFG